MEKQHCKRGSRLVLTVNFLRTHKKRKHDYVNNKLHTSHPDDTTIWKQQMLIITLQILNVGKGRRVLAAKRTILNINHCKEFIVIEK